MTTYSLDRVVEALWSDNLALVGPRADKLGRHRLPSRPALIEATNQLRAAFFPGHFGAAELSRDNGRFYVGAQLDAALQTLEVQIQRAMVYAAAHAAVVECGARARELTATFANVLPEIRRLLASDVQAAFEGDPAAASVDEAILCYPGIRALIHHRLAHELHRLEVPLIPRIISEYAHSLTGIDIHPGAQIGGSFFIDHGTGVVIGETAILGERVRLYQGVTLGAKRFPLDEQGNPLKNLPRHPIVEDDVVIYAGATLLGRITIGKGSTVGGNVWLTRSVPPGSRVTQAQSRQDAFSDGAGI